jgi:hypothetical protein
VNSLRGAEAPLFHGRASKNSGFLSTPSLALRAPVGMTRGMVGDGFGIRAGFNFKGSGQECPLHTNHSHNEKKTISRKVREKWGTQSLIIRQMWATRPIPASLVKLPQASIVNVSPRVLPKNGERPVCPRFRPSFPVFVPGFRLVESHPSRNEAWGTRPVHYVVSILLKKPSCISHRPDFASATR